MQIDSPYVHILQNMAYYTLKSVTKFSSLKITLFKVMWCHVSFFENKEPGGALCSDKHIQLIIFII